MFVSFPLRDKPQRSESSFARIRQFHEPENAENVGESTDILPPKFLWVHKLFHFEG